MARIAYFQPFSGASGDMALGAMVDAGLPLDALREGLESLALPGWRLEATRVTRGAFACTRVRVVLGDGASQASHAYGHGDHGHEASAGAHGHGPGQGRGHSRSHRRHGHVHGHGHSHSHGHGHTHSEERHLPVIIDLIKASGLPQPVKDGSIRVFQRLGEAEARMHGVPVDQVQFHEVGAVDSIVDIAGVNLGLHLLGVDSVFSSPVAIGTGFVEGAHGRMPLPAPATLELLRGHPVEHRDSRAELTTPTGAALLTTLAKGFGPMPPITVEKIGYGAGSDRQADVPNMLRLVLGTASDVPLPPEHRDRAVLLETNIDDQTPENTAFLVERLFHSGALDVWVTPIHMKKGRAAHEAHALVPPELERSVVQTFFRESTTLGLRRREMERWVLRRRSEPVRTPWGEVRVKSGYLGAERVTAAPEYEDVRRVALSAGKTFEEVYRWVMDNDRSNE